MTKLLAFHNDQKIKDFYIARVKAHYEADEIIKGNYWENGKGCAVGCTLHNSNHADYEKELGIPIAIARLEDRIFEGLPNAQAKEFPLQFLKVIRVGADLSMVVPKFIHWLLVDPEDGIVKFSFNKPIVQTLATLYERKINGETISLKKWFSIRKTAYAASAAASTATAYAAAASAYASAASASAAAAAASSAYVKNKVILKQAAKFLELLTEAI